MKSKPTTVSGNASAARWRVTGVVALLLLAPAIALWMLARPSPATPVAVKAPYPPRPVALTTISHPAKVDQAAEAADDIPLMQVGSEDSTEHGPRRPHPITPTRLRIYRENNLIGAMNAAMDLGRFAELRELNAQYREEYPEDENVLQEAYDIIADCQEDLSDERQARAREFWTKHRSSQLRRFVRRHCRL